MATKVSPEERKRNRILQAAEDRRVEIDARFEAIDMLRQFARGESVSNLPTRRFSILNYPGVSSKYNMKSYNRMRQKAFEKIKKTYAKDRRSNH